MRRADRLYALVDVLRARSPRLVARAELAERLEVTPRTVERDILALQQAGVPIWSQRGTGGGYAIEATWSLPPLNFDATEALAVIAALTSARSLPFADAGSRAEAKLLAAMSSAEAAKARQLAGRVRLDRSGRVAPRRIMAAVEAAVVERQVVELGYRDRHGQITARTVEAHGLHLAGTDAYLIGWCRLRDDGRAFRLDRIISVASTGETAPARDLEPLIGMLDDTSPAALDDQGGTRMATQPSRSPRGGGPPRRADHRTGSTPGLAAAVARSLPGATETAGRGGRIFSVGDVPFVTVGSEESITVRDETGKELTFVLATVPRDEVRHHVEAAWGALASAHQKASYRRRKQKRQALAPVTLDDVRRLALSLPGATEGPIWGTQVGFRVGTEKRTRFARFGPPIGDRVGNLVAPDDFEALVIFHCPTKPSLLESCPERFFTTPHYGPPDEPGGIITRLAENRGPDELQELMELLEDSWREVAAPDLVDQRDRDRR